MSLPYKYTVFVRNNHRSVETPQFRRHWFSRRAGIAIFSAVSAALLSCPMQVAIAQSNAPSLGAPDESSQVKSIEQRLRKLRGVPDDMRPASTKQLALDIRDLPASEQKVNLAWNLANLSTEGDAGRAVLQAVATTLEQALREKPDLTNSQPYVELASLVRYEGVQGSLNTPQYAAAVSQLEETDRKIENADFTLVDLNGKSWSLKTLRRSGKIVLANFWATWCPPCRKELRDLEALFELYKDDLVVLGISDEKPEVLRPFVEKNTLTYPILLDPDSRIHNELSVQGIPCSLVYGRNGKLAAQAMDMRTRNQFDEILKKVGLPSRLKSDPTERGAESLKTTMPKAGEI